LEAAGLPNLQGDRMETFGADARRLLRQASAAMNVLINFCNFLLYVKSDKSIFVKEVINECQKAIG
jgi:hypothetical protein